MPSSSSSSSSGAVSRGPARVKKSSSTRRGTSDSVSATLAGAGARRADGKSRTSTSTSSSTASSTEFGTSSRRSSTSAATEGPIASPQNLMPGKKKKKKKKTPIDFSVEAYGTLSTDVSAAASPLASASRTRRPPAETRHDPYESSLAGTASGSGSASRKDFGEEERHFREEAVVNQMSTPKRIKKKNSLKTADAIRIDADHPVRAHARSGSSVNNESEQKRGLESRVSGAGSSSTSKPQHSDDDDDGAYDAYADDFEDYADDFEDGDAGGGLESKHESAASQPTSKSPKAPAKKKANPFAPQLRRQDAASGHDDDVARHAAAVGKGTFKRELRKPPHRAASRKGDREGLQTLDHRQMEVGIAVGKSGGRISSIKSLVTFRKVRFDHFEQHSLPAWEFYMRSVAAGGTKKQAFTQTSEDRADVEMQTDQVPMRHVCVDRDAAAHETDLHAPSITHDALPTPKAHRGDENEECETKSTGAAEGMQSPSRGAPGPETAIDPRMLLKLELMCVATLEENSAVRANQLPRRAPSRLLKRMSRSRPRRQGLGLESRKLVSIAASHAYRKVFVTVHGPCRTEDVLEDAGQLDKTEARRIAKSSILCLWDFRLSASWPQFYMTCVGSATSALISPGAAAVVLAGTEDGIIFAWDLRGRAPSHAVDADTPVRVPQQELIPPSYSTAAETALERTHMAAICELELIITTPVSAGGELGFQIASLDTEANLHIWAVMHHSAPVAADVDDLVGNDARAESRGRSHGRSRFAAEVHEPNSSADTKDLGAFGDGELRCHHVAMIDGLSRGVARDPEQQLRGGGATTMAFQPGNSTRVLVASSDGRILHCSRLGQKAFPPNYVLRSSGPNAFGPCEFGGNGVTSIAFSPFLNSFFVAGYASGTVALFHVDRRLPLKTWEMTTSACPESGSGYAAVRTVSWSRRSASSFYVLDSKGTMHAWDVLAGPDGPLLAEEIPGSLGMVTCGGFAMADLQSDTFAMWSDELCYVTIDGRVAAPVAGQPSLSASLQAKPDLQDDAENQPSQAYKGAGEVHKRHTKTATVLERVREAFLRL